VTHNKKGVQTMHRNRVKVTLNDDAAVALRRVSLASGESMSGIIASLLDPHVEALIHMSELLEQAAELRADLPDASKQIMRSVLAGIRQKSKPVNETLEAPEMTPERKQLIADTLASINRDASENPTMPTDNENRSADASAGRLSDWELAELEETTVSIGGLDEYE